MAPAMLAVGVAGQRWGPENAALVLSQRGRSRLDAGASAAEAMAEGMDHCEKATRAPRVLPASSPW